MAHYSYFLVSLIVIFSQNLGECAEFVPVYMWGTNKLTEHVPALHKISQDSFKDTLLESLKNNPFIIVFAERTLSPEDFPQRDQNGESAFANLQQLKKEGSYVSYRPYVQNPVGAIKQINKPVTDISISSIISSIHVPKDNIWIVNLDDARDDETRFHMLKRHDLDMVSIYKDTLKLHDNVLALYTANHTAWVAPDDVTHGKSRFLLQNDEAPDSSIIFNGSEALVYLTEQGRFGDINITDKFEITAITEQDNVTITLKSPAGSTATTINFSISRAAGYWYINNITINDKNVVGLKSVYAPVGFSYHCGSFNLTTEDAKWLFLPGFQLQPFFQKLDNPIFGDAYDCVGFTSVPIWSGLFVTALLLLIITFGLTMMMDIKTMDRFDDPKGKTITITAAE